MGVPYFTQRSDCGIWEERALDGARQREMARDGGRDVGKCLCRSRIPFEGCERAREALRDLIRMLSGEELGQVLIQLKMTTLGYASTRLATA
jgi:hypothetical protein